LPNAIKVRNNHGSRKSRDISALVHLQGSRRLDQVGLTCNTAGASSGQYA
jgi:hypothetical protein